MKIASIIYYIIYILQYIYNINEFLYSKGTKSKIVMVQWYIGTLSILPSPHS